MNDVNTMVKLLNRVDVEWKELGKISENLDSMRKPIASGLREAGEIPYYGASGVVDYVKEYIFNGDFLLVSEDGANLIARNTPIAFSISGKNWVNNHAHVLNFNTYVERRFVEFFLNSIDLTPYISGAAQPKLNQRNLNSIKIPIPHPENSEKSLKIQAEIVRILDNFTELTAELTARKKQYYYYREQLFNFDGREIEWKKLGDVGEFIRGKRFVKTDMISQGTPCIHYGEMYTHYGIWANKTKSFVSNELVLNKKLRTAEKDDVILVAAGETIEDIGLGTAWLGDEGVVIHDACFFYKSPLNSKYVAYFTRTRQFQKQIKKHISSGKISAINAKGLSKTIIPIPSQEEQARIVAILDKFDTLTNSISEGLPREIELRKKQYEYYRDMLLSFPKIDVKA